MFVIADLFLVPAYLVRACGQFCQGDGADRHFGGELSGIQPLAKDHDADVEQPLLVLSGHRDRPAPDQPWRPDRISEWNWKPEAIRADRDRRSDQILENLAENCQRIDNSGRWVLLIYRAFTASYPLFHLT